MFYLSNLKGGVCKEPVSLVLDAAPSLPCHNLSILSRSNLSHCHVYYGSTYFTLSVIYCNSAHKGLTALLGAVLCMPDVSCSCRSHLQLQTHAMESHKLYRKQHRVMRDVSARVSHCGGSAVAGKIYLLFQPLAFLQSIARHF